MPPQDNLPLPQDIAPADPDRLAAAFEHSITWEDDIWRADPVDVGAVHAKARDKFYALMDAVTSDQHAASMPRILLFHGQSGAGKTHLIRALRTGAHRLGKAYFGYAQMTPDVSNYADYYLRRLINSLEQPYDPDDGGATALTRLTRHLVSDAEVMPVEELERLREADIDETELARFVLQLADDVVASPKFADDNLDVNIVRALLYLQRADPRIDQRVRQYLQGRPLNALAHAAVAALDPHTGEGRSFEIIESLGRLMWSVDKAALVFAIDQVEDLRNFDDAEERFQKAVGNLMQIANRVPRAIIIISSLEEFYGQARAVLPQSYIDRVEKGGPVALLEARSAEEARLIIAKRLEHRSASEQDTTGSTDPSAYFGPNFFEEFGGLSTRRLLEHAQNCLRGSQSQEPEPATPAGGFLNSLVAALGFAPSNDPNHAIDPPPDQLPDQAPAIDYREVWDHFSASNEAEMPAHDAELMDVLIAALERAREEWSEAITGLSLQRLELCDDVPALDLMVKHKRGHAFEARVFLCNRPTQGGGFKRQLDKVLGAMGDHTCFMLRASDFPPNKKNQTAQAYRKFREGGGRSVLVPIPDWERMMAVRQFYDNHRHDPGFAFWFAQARLLSGLAPLIQLLRLDLLERPVMRREATPEETITGVAQAIAEVRDANPDPHDECGGPSTLTSQFEDAEPGLDLADPGGSDGLAVHDRPDCADGVPLEVLLDENANNLESIFVGRLNNRAAKGVTLNKDVLKRHAAVLGGSGSGKTTLALSLIEQLLLRGIPAVLIDRKGDLCSYANPDVWRFNDADHSERQAEREKLGDAIDVAVYTPGRASGRPISITLLPTGISELPEHEQLLLANMSAAALGDMLHLKNSATHQKQSGTLSVALKILGARSRSEVTLDDLIYLLEDEDPELTELTQRMDPSGKIRRDLVAQLDSLRHRNSALFDGGGESLRMESLLGLGPFAREGRTRLSVIYTGFLGDNENILFWVSQFLSEALRFCQRNPNDALQALVMFDEADLYIPANAKPATAEPLQSLLKRARSAGLGLMLATQSPGDLDYKSRDQITSWFIGRVREDTALRKLRAAFQSESGLDPAAVLPHQTVGEFHLVQEGLVRPMKAQRSLIDAEQVPFDRIEQLARETKGQDEQQLKLFDIG